MAAKKILNLQFSAFIPGSLGKPLKEYFLNDFLNNDKTMRNHAEFNAELNKIQGSWLAEPGLSYIPQFGGIGHFGRYFSTDNREFGGVGSSRLTSTAAINLSQVGSFDPSKSVFTHSCSDSHLIVTAIVDMNPSMPNGGSMPSLSVPNISGSVGKTATKRSQTTQNVDVIRNDVFGVYFTAPNTPRSTLIDGTEIKTAASAGYPFLEPFSPNIDYRLTVVLRKIPGNIIKAQVTGSHDSFPFYELVANGKVKYRYNAKDNGETGPNPVNLNRMKNFSVEWIERN